MLCHAASRYIIPHRSILNARTPVVLLCCLCLSSQLGGAEQERPRYPWLRRITWAAGCAASFWDAQATISAVRRGADEGNPLPVNQQGAPRWGRIVAFKAGTCASTFAVERLATRLIPGMAGEVIRGAATNFSIPFLVRSDTRCRRKLRPRIACGC